MKKRSISPGKWILYLILAIQAAVTTYPLIWMVVSSLKDNVSFFADPWSIPKNPQFVNYVTAWKEGIQDYMINSIVITIATLFIVIILSCAFSFMVARFPFKGGGLLVGMFFAGMMIPVHCTLVPLYSMMNGLGWLDSLWALLFPYVASGLPLAIFLTYGHYQQIPMELEEAARMDGCGVIRMFLYIFLPLAKPVISTIGILTAISVWNEFIFANIIISDPLKKTLPVGLLALKGTYNTNYAAVRAELNISSIPIIIVYILMSGKIQAGMVSGAVKS